MPLSTHVRRFSLSQWRYYYNQLLFIDAPLTATFIKGLMPLTGKSPTVEIEPITANDHQPSEALDTLSEELSPEELSPEGLSPSELVSDEFPLNELTFDELPLLPIAAPLTQKRLTQTPVLNIYSDRLLNREENNVRNIVVELATQSTIKAMTPRFTNSGSRQRPAIELTKVATAQSRPVRASKVEIPAALCQVSDLLASFVTQ